MKIIRSILLFVAALLTVFLFFKMTPASPELSIGWRLFSSQGMHFHGITSNYGHSTFNSRIISYALILLFFFSLKEDKRIKNDNALLFLAGTGFITEIYNLINIRYIRGWTSVLHWDFLLVFLLINRIYLLNRSRE